MSFQVHTIYKDSSQEWENVDSLDEANKIIKRNKSRGAKSADAMMFKGAAPDPIKAAKMSKLLKSAESINPNEALLAQDQLREMAEADREAAKQNDLRMRGLR